MDNDDIRELLVNPTYIDQRKVSSEQIEELRQLFQLKTPRLVMVFNHLALSGRDKTQRVEFNTGPVITPIDILGAIYTYYNMPIEEADVHDERDYPDDDDEARERLPSYFYREVVDIKNSQF